MASRMTLRVGRVRPGGEVEFAPTRTVTVRAGKGRSAVPENPCAFPPCRCPRHRPDLHQGADAVRALRVLKGYPYAESMAALRQRWRE